MKNTTKMLAASLHKFLQKNGCVVTTLVRTDTYELHYTLAEDIKPQPPIIVKDSGGFVIPPGSQESVVNAILVWLTSSID